MFGKASVLMVMGFSLIFLSIGYNFNMTTSRAVDNMAGYYENTNAHNIAVSAANMAASALYFDKTWTPGSDWVDVPFNDGSYTVELKDTMTDKKLIIASGTFRDSTKQIRVLLQPSNFAKYGNFYNTFTTTAAATGDTFDGHFHSNDYVSVYGNPVFLGKTTSKNGLKKWINPSNPEFHGGFETGIEIPLEFPIGDLDAAASSDGHIFQSTNPAKPFIEVDLEYLGTDVKYKTRIGNGSSWDAWGSDTTVPLSSLSPNGLLLVKKGNLYLEGTLDGRSTIAVSEEGAGSSYGNIYIEDDIVYNEDPRTNPGSNDMLGLIPERSVEVTFDNSRGDLDIHASMYMKKEGLQIKNYSSYSSIHNMNILGGVIAQKPYATAQYSGTTPVKGYRFIHDFDERFLLDMPPHFPHTKNYEVISWFE